MKRYVLLEDKRIFNGAEIVDAGNYNGKRVIHSDDKGYFLGYMEKESDNLIDLLEVGDCYETKDAEIYSIDNTYQLTEQKAFYSYNVNLINAIWKRNGDIMRRYER